MANGRKWQNGKMIENGKLVENGKSGENGEIVKNGKMAKVKNGNTVENGNMVKNGKMVENGKSGKAGLTDSYRTPVMSTSRQMRNLFLLSPVKCVALPRSTIFAVKTGPDFAIVGGARSKHAAMERNFQTSGLSRYFAVFNFRDRIWIKPTAEKPVLAV
jgi:hypothetical protein